MPSPEGTGLPWSGRSRFSQVVSTQVLICSNVSSSGPGSLRVWDRIKPRTTGFLGASAISSMNGLANTSSIRQRVTTAGGSVITVFMFSFLFVGFEFAQVGHELVRQHRH